MRKRIPPFLGIVLTVFMAAFNCFAQGTLQPIEGNKVNQQGQAKTIFSFKSEIGLTDDQEVKLKALLYDQQTFLDTNSNILKNLEAVLNNMIQSKEDMQVIKSKLEEISKIQVEISYRNIIDNRKVETILTPTQLAKWRGIQKNYSS